MDKVCIFGDSIAWGAWDVENGGWVARLKQYFESKSKDTGFYNCSVSGETTKDLLKRFDVECSAREPKIIIFAIGINDSRYLNNEKNDEATLVDFKNNISKLIEKAKIHTKMILFVGLTYVNESETVPCHWKPSKTYTNERVNAYDASIKEICQMDGVPFIEMHDMLKDSDLYDGLHPNSEGHNKLFLRVKEFLISKNILQ